MWESRQRAHSSDVEESSEEDRAARSIPYLVFHVKQALRSTCADESEWRGEVYLPGRSTSG